jgi:RNA polymerase sigma factor (sigma-70 family)
LPAHIIGQAFFMTPHPNLIPQLYRAEFSKITAVLCRNFGMEHLEMAEDVVSDTFLLAAETWGVKGVPPNPVAWLYTVAKNRAIDVLKRDTLFNTKISADLTQNLTGAHEDLAQFTEQHITDSQLQMMFAVCHPSISAEAQTGLALRILCGFSIVEIADAFVSNTETINKRLFRAKQKLRENHVRIELPPAAQILSRLKPVLTTVYLLFNEGYYSASANVVLRRDLCLEAMRLNYMLVECPLTDKPAANALLALMCFHASRFDARVTPTGESILYEDQDTSLWNHELIVKGKYYLNKAAKGEDVCSYHLEAMIAYWHTDKTSSSEKWTNILQLYNRLLVLEYSPMAALNRTYALYKVFGNTAAITEAEKLNLGHHHLYHSLLGELYTGIDHGKAVWHFQKAIKLSKSAADQKALLTKLNKLKGD